MFVGGGAALVLAGGLAMLLGGGGNSILPFRSPPPISPVSFTLEKVTAATTTATTPTQAVHAAEPIGAEVHVAMTMLFEGAFVEPDVWRHEDYADVFSQVMDESAAAQALNDIDVLTLGAGADDTYEVVTPGLSSLTVTVLMDGKDHPTQAIAKVTFNAVAELDDHTYSAIIVTGSFFFRPQDGTWKIFSYEVDKDEEPTQAPSSPTPSATTEASP